MAVRMEEYRLVNPRCRMWPLDEAAEATGERDTFVDWKF